MSNKLTISILALVASTGLAFAQGAGGGGGGAGGAGGGGTATENAPGGGGAAGSPSAGSGSGSGPAMDAPGQRPPGAAGRGDRSSAGERAPEKAGKSAQGKSDDKAGKAGEEGVPETRTGDSKAGKRAGDPVTSTSGSGKTAAGKDGAAAGKDGNGASVNVTSAQRTRVKTVFTRQKPAAQNVNVDVRVGVAVPRTVRLAVVPEDVVVIVPAYRKYRHFGVGNQVCIVDPVTYAIVDIIVIA